MASGGSNPAQEQPAAPRRESLGGIGGAANPRTSLRASALPTPTRRASRGHSAAVANAGLTPAPAKHQQYQQQQQQQQRRGSLGGDGGARLQQQQYAQQQLKQAPARYDAAPGSLGRSPAGAARAAVQQRQMQQPTAHQYSPDRYAAAPGQRTPVRPAAAARHSVTPVRNSPANAVEAHAARQGRTPADSTANTTTAAAASTPTATTARTTPGRTTLTPGRRASNGTPGRDPATAGFSMNTASSLARARATPNRGTTGFSPNPASAVTRNGATPDRRSSGFGANTTSAAARHAPTPDRGTAPLSRATPLQASGTTSTRVGLTASPYARRTSYGNGPGIAHGSNVARRLNLNPTPASSENNPGSAYASSFGAGGDPKDRRRVSASGAPVSPYVRRNVQGGSRITIDRVDRTPLSSFSSLSNVPQEMPASMHSNMDSARTSMDSAWTSMASTTQASTQQSSGRRVSALESFRNSRRLSGPKKSIPAAVNLGAKDPSLPEVPADPPAAGPVTCDSEPADSTLLSRMDAVREFTIDPEASKPMPDRKEEPLGYRGGPAWTTLDSNRGTSVPSSPNARKISDRFAEEPINVERVDRMSMSLSRRRSRSRGQSGGPADFPEETPTLTVTAQRRD